ncbi:MAG: trypsin-like peptidase domain-containing protein, partial [Gemmatimonadota bacterium]
SDLRPDAVAGGGTEARSAGGADGEIATQEGARNTPLVGAARRVTPSVVSITVRRPSTRSRSLLDQFFGSGEERYVPGLGSGFAIDDEGHVLTNAHVVEDAAEIWVVEAGGRIYRAEVIGSDELTDIAVLRIEPGRVPAAPLGTSSDLVVGEPALAVGNPFGFDLANTEATVTSGVISGLGRDIRSSGQRGVLYADMVQTDASINPGNSGGPLVNAHGEVVGVNSSILSRTGGSVGLGFAIPIDRALRVAEELRRFGRVRQPWVGVDVASTTTDSVVGLSVVRRVASPSPAAESGLREEDVVVSVDGRRIDSPLDWEIALLDAGVGSRVEVRVRRDGDERTIPVRVEEVPSERADRVEVLQEGLRLVTVDAAIAQERGLTADRGALIVEIEPSLRRATRMQEGDVIVAVNRRRVNTAEDAAELFRSASAGRGVVQVWLYRDGTQVATTFRVR